MKEITVKIEGYNDVKVPVNTSIEDIVDTLNIDDIIIAAIIDNELYDLSNKLRENTSIKLVRAKDKVGNPIYQNGLKFLFMVAVKELFGKTVNVNLRYAMDKIVISQVDIELNDEKILLIKNKMKELVEEALPIKKVIVLRKDAIKYFENIGEEEIKENYENMTNEAVLLYSIKDYYSYFYSVMPTNTKYLTDFTLLNINRSVIISPPFNDDDLKETIAKLNKTFKVFEEYAIWSNKLHIDFLKDVNNKIIEGRISEFIELNEIKQNSDIERIANQIKDNISNIKLVCLGGPSSSGKTTTTKKLNMYLKSMGINPFIISMDDYFVNRVDTPKDENGKYLFNIPETVDIKLFNEDLTKLLNNEEIRIPEFNFITGKREYNRPLVSLKDRDLLIIEGLHSLNEKMTFTIPRENKFKIYVSPFTPLAMDRVNHIPTIDIRLIRMMVRDNRTRGRDAISTFSNFKEVRENEEKYIYPCQKDADAVLNTVLIYELGMLKTYALPILMAVKRDSEYYKDAIRIINFLKNVLAIQSEYLPNMSVLREFIGNGYFE